MKIWKLYAMERPTRDGVYEVRLRKIDSLIDSQIETIMEFRDGKWDTKVPMFINEYQVQAWRDK